MFFLLLPLIWYFDIHQIDIITTYLQEDLNEKIYIEISDGMEKLDT